MDPKITKSSSPTDISGEPDYKLVAYHFQLVTPVASEVDPGQLCRERVPVARLNELCGKDFVMVEKMMMVMRRRKRRRRMRMTKVFPGVPGRPAATEVVQVHGQDVKVCVLPFLHRRSKKVRSFSYYTKTSFS